MIIRPGLAKFVLVFSMLIMGACGLMYEYVLSVMGNYLMGTSHEQIFIIIGLMLFAMGVGALVQRAITKNLMDFFVILEILLGFLGGISGIVIYAAHANWESFAVILYGFAFVIGMLIGMEVPILIRINEEYSQSLKTNLSEILTVDYVGSLIGAFLFTYIFLVYVPLTSISFVLGLANTFLALIALFYFWRLVQKKKLITGSIMFSGAVLVWGLWQSPVWTMRIEQKYYRDPIVHAETTRFQHLVLTKMDDRVNLYINGHLQFSSMDEGIYHEYLVHVPMLLAPSRKRVLILGGGDGLAAREVLKYPDVEQIVLVDIDPAVTRLARTQPDLVRLNQGSLTQSKVVTVPAGGLKRGMKVDLLIPDRRLTKSFADKMKPVTQVHLLHVDADKFVSHVNGQFDVVLVDFPDPGLVELAKLYSLDFYRSLRKRIKPASFVSIQSGSPFYAKDAFICIGKTIHQAGFHILPYRGNVPSFHGEWGWYLAWQRKGSKSLMSQTRDFLSGAELREAIDDPRHRKIISQLNQKKTFPVSTHYLTPQLAAASFEFGKNQWTSKQNIRINTKMNPILVHYYRESWKHW